MSLSQKITNFITSLIDKLNSLNQKKAEKTITIQGTGSLTGGGTLESNRDIDLTQEAKDKIEEGVDAYKALQDFGGRNLLIGTSEEWRSATATSYNIYPFGGGGSSPTITDVEEGESYVFSATVRSNNQRVRLHVRFFNETGSTVDNTYSEFIDSEDEGRLYLAFTVPENAVSFFLAIRRESNDGSTIVDYKKAKLEIGNVATDWTPAPEDQVTDWDETNPDSFSFLKNKPNSFPPSAHTHTIGEVTNLQTALNNKEDAFSKNSAFNKDFGTTAGTVMEGDDKRITNGGVLRTIVSLDSNFDIDTLKNPEHVGLYEGEFDFPVLGNIIGGGGGDKRGVLEVVEVSGTIMHIFKTLKGDVYTRFYDFDAWNPWILSATQQWTINNFPTFSDLYGVNTVMEGGYYLIPGEAYKYSVWASKYVIDGILYNERIRGEVTLSEAHPTLNRFDLIVVTTDEQEPFKVIEGVPAENPVRPNFDTESEVDLTFIYVNSISDGGGQVGNFLLVYDENEGWPNEANTSTDSPSFVDLASTEQSFNGNKSIKVWGDGFILDKTITFILPEKANLEDYTQFVAHLYREGGEDFKIRIRSFKFIDTSNDQIVLEISNRSWFVRGEGWSSFSFSIDETREFDKLEIVIDHSDPTPLYIDYIFLSSDTGTGTSGGQNLIERTSQIPINDGATGVSPYAEIRDLPAPFDPTYLENAIQNLEDNKQDNLGFTPENVANKAVTLAGANDTTYPTTKAVADALETKLIVKTANFTISPINDDQAIIINKGFTCTINPNLAFTNVFVFTMKNDSMAGLSIVMGSRVGYSYSVNGSAPVASGTITLDSGGTCTVVFDAINNKFYLDGSLV